MAKTRFMRDMLSNPACATFGHSWAVRIRAGRPVELCTACGISAPPITPDSTEGK